MPRLPTTSDFPPSLTLTITPNPEHASSSLSSPPHNILLLLHGLGDTHHSFSNLARQLNLPATAVLTLRGLHPLPFSLLGYHWADHLTLDQSSGSLDPDGGFVTSTRVLSDIIAKTLVAECGFEARDVLIWGFGQGGMLALAAAEALEGGEAAESGEGNEGSGGVERELGGVITVGGPLPEAVRAREKGKGKGTGLMRTPVIVLGGTEGTAVGEEQVGRVKRVWEFVERVRWRRSGDGMPRDRGEMMPIMQFLARRLRAGAPKGAVEVA